LNTFVFIYKYISSEKSDNKNSQPASILPTTASINLSPIRLRVQESSFKLIAEGHEQVNPGDDAALVIPLLLLVLFM
jgi:hypothetical protein